ncbi:uncharacterized protein LOC122370192 [Amphibalanus amphitrite]|uniref:uncharacterized protein LOC122370192 n=1 Tax=Amphibalanus amphitrite TaxID=1232801 RepID=UPI001C8FE8D1|nr:uncharacterized protein LOC122370192 [Amphibalanus amphitrite]
MTPFSASEYDLMSPTCSTSRASVQDAGDHGTWTFPEHLMCNQTEITAPENHHLEENEYGEQGAESDVSDGVEVAPPQHSSQSRTSQSARNGASCGEVRKKNVCIYCKQKRNLIWRHIKTVHRDEKEVKDIQECDSEQERKMKITVMINKGNMEHNKLVLQRGEGDMILGRKSDQASVDDYVPCPYCYLFVVKTNMMQHIKHHCVARKTECPDIPTVLAESRTLLSDGQEENTGYHKDILSRMHDDAVTKTIKNDELLKKWGANLHAKLGRSGFAQISQRLRMMGEVVQAAGKSMQELINGEGFDTVVSATKSVCGFEQDKLNAHTGLPTYKTPSKAMRIGGELRQLAALKKGIALIKKEESEVKDAEAFLYHVDQFWNVKISSVALKNRESNKYDKKDMLPFTSDLKLFTEKMKERVKEMTEKGIHGMTDYARLSKAVLARLLVFNKRRPKELSSILLQSWINREMYKQETVEEVNKSMGETEKKLFNELDVVMSRGKCGNKVPTLIPSDCAAPLQLLVDNRETYIDKDNKYLFANPLARTTGHYNAGVVLKEQLSDMALNRADLFHATKLRKYCATTSQILEMGEFDMEVLTRHMGHDKDVHRGYYRLSDATHELTRASILMMKLDEGCLSKYSGRSLEEMLTEEDFDEPGSENEGGPADDRQEDDEGGHEQRKKPQKMCRIHCMRTRSQEASPYGGTDAVGRLTPSTTRQRGERRLRV